MRTEAAADATLVAPADLTRDDDSQNPDPATWRI